MEKIEIQNLKEGLVKAFSYVVVSILLFSANIYLDTNLLASVSEKISEKSFVLDTSKDLDLPINGKFRFFNEENFVNNIEEVFVDEDNREYVFRLNSGRIWVNTEISNAKINIIVGNTVVIPDNSIFDLKYIDGKMELSTYNGETYLAFLNEVDSIFRFSDQFSDIYSNVLLVARDTFVKLTMSKVSADFSKLLPLKLAKSMDTYSSISGAMREEPFVKENIGKDFSFFEDVRSTFRMSFSSPDYAVSNGFVSEIIRGVKSNLVFSDTKNKSLKINTALSYLNSAIHFSVNSDLANAKNSLLDFDLFVKKENLFSDLDFLNVYNAYLDLLSIFKASDSEFLIVEHFISSDDMIIEKNFMSLNTLRRNVYSSMDFSDLIAISALKTYYQEFDKFLPKIRKDSRFEKFISFQNQILDNLFLRSSIFYSEEFFRVKQNLEDLLLDTIQDEYLREEVVQSFISMKFDFLARAWSFLKTEKLSLENADMIYSMLISDIKDYLSDEKIVKLAVSGLFNKQLETVLNQYAYIQNFEYNSSVLFGSTHAERFDAYIENRAFIPNLGDFSDTLATQKTVEDVASQIVELFEQNSLSNIDILDLEQFDQRFVKFSARISGYDFTALFDRESESVKEIFAYDELVSESPVKFSNLLTLLERKFADIDLLEEEVDVDEEIESHAQRVAKNFVMDFVSSYGFVVELSNISISNLDSTVFRLENIYQKDNNETVLSFDYSSKDEKARNLYIIYDSRPVVLDGPFSLEELSSLLIDKTDFEALAEELVSKPLLVDTEETTDKIEEIKISR